MFLTKCRSGLLAIGLLFAAVPARADVTYPISYVVTGVSFGCDHYLNANCSVTSGVVSLFNNGGSLSFSATPLSGSFVESNVGVATFPLVTFNSTVTGPFATLPTGAGNEALFGITIFFTFTTPDGTYSNSVYGGFYRQPGNTSGIISILGQAYSIPSPSLPKGFGASASITSPPVLTFSTTTNGSGTISGAATISPEPSTIVLSASGLGIVGLVGIRRRRKSV